MKRFPVSLSICLLLALPAFAHPPTATPAVSPVQALATFKDCEECPDMAQIPAGSVTMGSIDEDGGISNQERVHRVRVSGYALSKTEITNAQFSVFVHATGYSPGATCWTFENGTFEERPDRSWRYPGFPLQGNHPVACLNLTDVNAYAQWLSRITGRQYRLPTESEWQYAAELGGPGDVSVANPWLQACVYGNVTDATGNPQIVDATWVLHSCTDGYSYSKAVAKLKPNALGLYDMRGNVWEWTQDCFGRADKHGAAADSSPRGSNAWSSRDCKSNVLRGGSWYADSQLVRSTYRIGFDPAVRNFSFGFRLASSLP
jgi:formylglycine-generating enzyme required for sulfatase activity